MCGVYVWVYVYCMEMGVAERERESTSLSSLLVQDPIATVPASDGIL